MPTAAEVIFLGTGVSECVPRITCLTADPPTCAVCIDAIRPGSKNRRRNTSIVVQFDAGGSKSNLLVDVGKTFYHAALEWFPLHRIETVDAVLLTHSHADCTGGFDDLRDWTNMARFARNDRRAEAMLRRNGGSIPVYLRPKDMRVVERTAYYLVDRSRITSGGTVAHLTFETIPTRTFDVLGIQVTPLEVPHGSDYTANGYRIGNFGYISDCSDVPAKVLEQLAGVETLVLDALRWSRQHGSHLSVEAAVGFAHQLDPPPRRTLLTGASHIVDHYESNRRLRDRTISGGLDVQYAWDGLRVLASV